MATSYYIKHVGLHDGELGIQTFKKSLPKRPQSALELNRHYDHTLNRHSSDMFFQSQRSISPTPVGRKFSTSPRAQTAKPRRERVIRTTSSITPQYRKGFAPAFPVRTRSRASTAAMTGLLQPPERLTPTFDHSLRNQNRKRRYISNREEASINRAVERMKNGPGALKKERMELDWMRKTGKAYVKSSDGLLTAIEKPTMKISAPEEEPYLRLLRALQPMKSPSAGSLQSSDY
eukprot:TRINITY_DN17500_c0_g1_i1.p1 TRINITY_DN17500_c0_g1~~TRINITY_DN17500_c0_g1_i1.p1  ORF type:complete len:233 (+),score=21.38 TRINITY_DN17500_c0_g1_i1:118-816(+)